MLHTLASNWWTLALRGLVSLVYGWLMFTLPGSWSWRSGFGDADTSSLSPHNARPRARAPIRSPVPPLTQFRDVRRVMACMPGHRAENIFH